MFLQKNARIARINGFFTNPVYLSLVVQLIRGNISILEKIFYLYLRILISSLKYRFSGIYEFQIKHYTFCSTSINYVEKDLVF